MVERAVVLSKASTITLDDLPANIIEQLENQKARTTRSMCLREALEEPEKKIIEMALRQHNWNRQLTAETLNINRTTLYKKMKRYSLEADLLVQSTKD